MADGQKLRQIFQSGAGNDLMENMARIVGIGQVATLVLACIAAAPAAAFEVPRTEVPTIHVPTPHVTVTTPRVTVKVPTVNGKISHFKIDDGSNNTSKGA